MKITKQFLIKKYWKEKLTTFEIATLCKVGQRTIMRYMEKFNVPRRKYGQHLKIKNYPTKNVLFKKYFIERKTQQEIADELNCCRVTIRNYLIKYNIKIRKTSKNSKKSRKYRKILTKEFLIEEYVENKKSTLTIAEEIGFSPSTVRKILIEHKILIRTKSEYLKGKNNGMYKDGRTLKKYFCIGCGTQLKGFNAYKAKRCSACYHEFKQGSNSPNWQGGITFEPYPLGWTKTFKEQIRYRDGYKCQVCGCPEVECNRKLDVHHIDYNKMNINIENLISLCQSCHMKTNFNRDYWELFFETKQVKNVTI